MSCYSLTSVDLLRQIFRVSIPFPHQIQVSISEQQLNFALDRCHRRARKSLKLTKAVSSYEREIREIPVYYVASDEFEPLTVPPVNMGMIAVQTVPRND